MGAWQTLLDVCPYIPIPLMAILFALGLWHEIVCSNRRVAAGIEPTKLYKTQVANNAIGYLT